MYSPDKDRRLGQNPIETLYRSGKRQTRREFMETLGITLTVITGIGIGGPAIIDWIDQTHSRSSSKNPQPIPQKSEPTPEPVAIKQPTITPTKEKPTDKTPNNNPLVPKNETEKLTVSENIKKLKRPSPLCQADPLFGQGGLPTAEWGCFPVACSMMAQSLGLMGIDKTSVFGFVKTTYQKGLWKENVGADYPQKTEMMKMAGKGLTPETTIFQEEQDLNLVWDLLKHGKPFIISYRPYKDQIYGHSCFVFGIVDPFPGLMEAKVISVEAQTAGLIPAKGPTILAYDPARNCENSLYGYSRDSFTQTILKDAYAISYYK